jgi:hypothetical protein
MKGECPGSRNWDGCKSSVLPKSNASRSGEPMTYGDGKDNTEQKGSYGSGSGQAEKENRKGR